MAAIVPIPTPIKQLLCLMMPVSEDYVDSIYHNINLTPLSHLNSRSHLHYRDYYFLDENPPAMISISTGDSYLGLSNNLNQMSCLLSKIPTQNNDRPMFPNLSTHTLQPSIDDDTSICHLGNAINNSGECW